MKYLILVVTILTTPFSFAENKPTLTVYAPDYFTSEWGPGPSIEKAFEDYDILGIAGEIGEAGEVPRSIHPTVAWNSGICKHTHRHHVDYFGPTPSQCVMMDGCFLVININKIGSCRFDEEMPANGMHKGDVDFTANATFRHGLKCATWPIWVRHDSEGVGSAESWNAHELCKEYFIKKWKFPNGKGFR